jgi:hypothetical protein
MEKSIFIITVRLKNKDRLLRFHSAQVLRLSSAQVAERIKKKDLFLTH